MALIRMPPYVNAVSRWNGVTIFSSRDIITSGLTSAILDFLLPLTSGGIRNISHIEFLDPENWGERGGVGLAVGTELLCSLYSIAEI
jgi:hypothetical protein